ncbi:hypothetical protein ABW20_dc0110520 [Dactylellina cionopaga]|nr:hypothetical protein ABW20_dc0110520 [Dactylellina cionopaga]
MGKEEVAEAVAYHDEIVADYEKRKAERMSGETCSVCDTPLYTDPGQHEMGIYLHAKKYNCVEGSWSYQTELPDWALPKEGDIVHEVPLLESLDFPLVMREQEEAAQTSSNGGADGVSESKEELKGEAVVVPKEATEQDLELLRLEMLRIGGDEEETSTGDEKDIATAKVLDIVEDLASK